MPRGRRPDPDALQAVKGRPNKRAKAKRNIAGAAAPGAVPGAPSSHAGAAGTIKAPSKLTAGAMYIWRELAPELERMNFMRITDRNAFGRYCQDLASYWEVTLQLRREDFVYLTETPHGKMKRVNPLFLIQERLGRRLEAMEDRFGLTPASRQQILLRMAQQPLQLPFIMGGDQPPPEAPQASPIGMLNPASRLN